VSYWRNAFLVMILISGADTTFIVGNLFTINALDEKSQALAGGLFSTATRISTSIGLAISSAVATAVTNSRNHSLGQTSSTPRTLLDGYHAAGWLCLACAVIGLVLNFVSLRGLGIVGGQKGVRRLNDVEEDANGGEKETPLDTSASSDNRAKQA